MSIVARRISFGLAFKLSALILLSTAAIFIIAFTYNYRVSKRLLLNDAQEKAGNLAQATANKIGIELHGIEMIPRFIARELEGQPLDQAHLESLVRNAVATNPAVFGSTIAFQPRAFDPTKNYFAPYACRKEDAIELTYIGDSAYQYHEMDWFTIPRELDQPAWSEPYFDEGGGNVAMATYSVPFYQTGEQGSTFMGVVTIDIALDWLQELANNIHIFDSGFVFILSQNGRFLFHPNSDHIMRESIFSLAESHAQPYWRGIGRAMIQGASDFIPAHGIESNKDSWLYYIPLTSAGWSLGILFPEEELFRNIRYLAVTTAFIACAGFALLFVLIILVATRITRPLRILSYTTTEIARGNLDQPLPVLESRDEVGALSHSFEDMRSALKEYINDLTETTAAKERIESELKIAQRIQMSFLPRRFPPFPDYLQFDIHARLEPAKEVGGDLYDFFLLDEDRLFFAVGDVTGKGVPAALFMAVTKTLLKGIALQGDYEEPGPVLAAVNNELCPENDTNMFVTLFCGCLNFKTGALHYANAGHNPPLLARGYAPPQWLDLPEGLVLGVMPDQVYPSRLIQLQPGDKIVAYTDGVTEAMNPQEELYSPERLLTKVKALSGQRSEAIVTTLMGAVHAFAENAPQSDDITLLALEYRGPANAG